MGLIPTLLLDSLSQTCVKQCHRVSSREAELTAPSSPDRWSFLAPCSHFYFGTSGTEVICSFNKYLPTYFEFGTVLGVRRVVNIKGEVLVLMGRQQISIQQNKHTHTHTEEWLPTPVFLPGEFHGQRSLADCSPWSHKELDMQYIS